MVLGSLMPPPPPPPPPFRATYAWQTIGDGAELPAGLEVELPLDGQAGRARIPPTWQLSVWCDDERGFWRCDLERDTTVGELRASAARHAGLASPDAVVLRLGDVSLDDDAATVEKIDLFARNGELSVQLKK